MTSSHWIWTSLAFSMLACLTFLNWMNGAWVFIGLAGVSFYRACMINNKQIKEMK